MNLGQRPVIPSLTLLFHLRFASEGLNKKTFYAFFQSPMYATFPLPLVHSIQQTVFLRLTLGSVKVTYVKESSAQLCESMRHVIYLLNGVITFSRPNNRLRESRKKNRGLL
jgi:hypothetical protein